jgi:hypothetical protein
MKVADNYRIESDRYNWTLVHSTTSKTLSEKTGLYPVNEIRTYHATLGQVVAKLVTLEVKGLDNLTEVLGSVESITEAVLEKLTHDLRTGPYRLLKHGEQL